MKNLLLVVMLFISGLSIAQHLPTNVWAVRSVVPEGDTSYNQNVNRYFTTASGDLCHPGYNIGEILSYTKLNATADNRVEIGTDLNNLTPQVGVGEWRAGLSISPQRGWYNRRVERPAGEDIIVWEKISQQGDPRFCNNAITSISNVRISAYNNQFERLHFSYNSLSPTRLRVIVSGDAGIDRDNTNGVWRVPIRWVENGGENNELVHTTEAGSGSYSVLVPKRQVGTVYRLNLSPGEREGNLGHMNHVVEDVVPGAFLTNINRNTLEFVIASDSPDGASVWIDRISRDGNDRDANNFYSRFGNNSSRFVETANRAGGKLRRYRVNIHTGDLNPYEAVRIDFNKGGYIGHLEQLNGPTITFGWHNNGARNRDDSHLSLNWDIDLPPGWDRSGLTNTIVRFFSNDGYGALRVAAETYTLEPRNTRNNGSAFLMGGHGHSNWEYHDNAWELGVSLDYRGSRYRIKLVDRVDHNHPNGRPEGGPRAGSISNGIRSNANNRDTRGGSHNGYIHFNNDYSCRNFDGQVCDRPGQ